MKCPIDDGTEGQSWSLSVTAPWLNGCARSPPFHYLGAPDIIQAHFNTVPNETIKMMKYELFK